MEPVYSTKITKIKGKEKFERDDILVREIKLEIYVNGEKVGAVMATPVDQEALAIGYLMSENIIEKFSDVTSLKLLNDGMQVHIEAKVNVANIKKLNAEGVVISGCGRSMTANIDPEAIEAKVIKSDFTLRADLLCKEMGQFYTECPLYEQTGCVHTAKLFTDAHTYFIGEDIAQHNTIDKVVGKAQIAGVDVRNAFLMVSGRLSSEMVAKAVMHQIPILASRTASTCLGLMIAEKFGLTLIGFVRGDTMNVYRNPQRIIVEE
ncbi:formate dehydrogenase accessory protein FdhD [Sulfurospirillum diekertiae]|uniref:Sulfur carrier protein FdhD n=1 Tax=Sulfurospirillum diekertiae TaxID=1854492 RepID=A0A1Y0HR71_9BACT|nr:formate dehydrogenase accessory sulfurtransferase FdhD [Sulfurospirillum diekertiae]ARU49795.1 Sulfurtransferase FdhD [Sulfurospirillum diekertiae]ASC94588.1 Sulfurtransferase FdhD [Sulfurospirillum diekertiae]ATB70649.1 formate dehydrogenase accessory protein FdhD [Sulfurospirillum diekertiae]